MKKFLMFDFLITPWIIRISYWLLQLIIIVVGLKFAFNDTNINYSDFGYFLDDLSSFFPFSISWWFFIIAGSILLRLVFESIIVIFKISENSSQIKSLLKNNNLIEEDIYQEEEEEEENNDNQLEEE